jgi:hypothetical protein
MHGVRHDDYTPVIVFGFARIERDGPVEQINLIDSKVQQFRDSPAEGVTNLEESPKPEANSARGCGKPVIFMILNEAFADIAFGKFGKARERLWAVARVPRLNMRLNAGVRFPSGCSRKRIGGLLCMDTSGWRITRCIRTFAQALWCRSTPVRPRSSRRDGRTNSIAPFTSWISATPTCAVGAKWTGTSLFLFLLHNPGDRPDTSAILGKPISLDGSQ